MWLSAGFVAMRDTLGRSKIQDYPLPASDGPVDENTWAASLTSAVHRVVGVLIAGRRIPAQAVSDHLDVLEVAR